MSELWIVHHSIHAWQEPGLWSGFFEEAQRLLGCSLTHLDINDPIRRKVASLEDAGNFMSACKAREESRWLFGKFGEVGIEFSVRHFRQVTHYPNTLKWHVPLSFADKPENRQRLKSLFDLGNRTFQPFYGYSDEVTHIANKKKATGAVDLQTELLGVFWLTYFDAAYSMFFGNKKLSELPSIERGTDGSTTVVLGDSPQSVTSELRKRSAATLGEQSFVDPSEILEKQRGRFALTFEQLLP